MANYELRVDTLEMKKALDVLSTVINRKNALPILADAKLSYDRETRLFSLTAGNTEQYLTIVCTAPSTAAEDIDNGTAERKPWLFLDGDDKAQPFESVCINVADFKEAFGMLPQLPAMCQLTMQENGGSLKVNYGRGEFTLPVELGTDYPMPPAVLEKGQQPVGTATPLVKFNIDTQRLLPLINAARCCAANDELRPVINTVLIDCFHDHCVVVATDGHSLYKNVVDTGMGWLVYGEFAVTASAKLLIPTQAMQALIKSMAGTKAITITADTQRVNIKSTDGVLSLTTVMIDGAYPNYESVIPAQQPHSVTVDRLELVMCLKRTGIFSAEASNMCMVRREDDVLQIDAADDAMGRAAKEGVTIINPDSTLPDDFVTGVKISTLQKLLDCISTEQLRMEINEAATPILLKEEGRVSSLTLLLMPMKID